MSRAVIRHVGLSHKPFFMKRLQLSSHHDPLLFQTRMEGKYHWLRIVQYASKLRTVGRDPRRTASQSK